MKSTGDLAYGATDIALDAAEAKMNPNTAAARRTGMIPQRQRPPPGYYRDLVPQDSYAAPSYQQPVARGTQPDPDPYLAGFGLSGGRNFWKKLGDQTAAAVGRVGLEAANEAAAYGTRRANRELDKLEGGCSAKIGGSFGVIKT